MRARVGSFHFNMSLSFTAAAEQMDTVCVFCLSVFFLMVQLRVVFSFLFSLSSDGLFFANACSFSK